MKVYRTRGVVPHGGRVRYVDPDDGWRVAHPYYGHVVREAHAHRVKAGLGIPHDWERWVEERICEATPTACLDVVDLPEEDAGTTWPKMALQFAKSMFTWMASGFQVVTWDQFRARREQCSGEVGKGIARCEHYHPSGGGFQFAHCGKCGCTKLKLFLATEKCPIGKWGVRTEVP